MPIAAAQPGRPRIVTWSLVLLWLDLALSSLHLAGDWAVPETFLDDAALDRWILLFSVSIQLLFAWLYVKIAQGRNWARRIFIGWTFFTFGLLAAFYSELSVDWLDDASMLITLVAGALATGMLLTRTARGFCRKPPARAERPA